MQPPPGWGNGSTVWRLHKGVNGLKQAARAWNVMLTSTLRELGFHASRSDTSLYISGATYILCYVDDLIAGSKEGVIRANSAIAKSFKCEGMGETDLFLGMKIMRNRAKENCG
jgi:hypothetical protein